LRELNVVGIEGEFRRRGASSVGVVIGSFDYSAHDGLLDHDCFIVVTHSQVACTLFTLVMQRERYLIVISSHPHQFDGWEFIFGITEHIPVQLQDVLDYYLLWYKAWRMIVEGISRKILTIESVVNDDARRSSS